MPAGRPRIKPTVHDAEAMQRFCDHLVAGKTMKWAGEQTDCPNHQDVYRECARDPEFAQRIARVRELQQDAFTAQTIEMADEATESDHQVVKLRIWARQWYASKMNARYREKSDLKVDGSLTLEALVMQSMAPKPTDEAGK